MATTVTSTKTAERRETKSGGGSKFPGPNGKGRRETVGVAERKTRGDSLLARRVPGNDVG